MSKITKTRFLRKFRDIKLPVGKHLEFATIIDKGKEVKFPVSMSPGQIVNIKKAYKRYKASKQYPVFYKYLFYFLIGGNNYVRINAYRVENVIKDNTKSKKYIIINEIDNMI